MPTFTPPTYKGKLAPEQSNHKRHSLWRHYDWRDVGYNVLITGGVAVTSPGVVAPDLNALAATDDGSGEGGKAWFRGGIEYTITAGEKTILDAAGHTTVP